MSHLRSWGLPKCEQVASEPGAVLGSPQVEQVASTGEPFRRELVTSKCLITGARIPRAVLGSPQG